jgi:hypothetical protein
LSGPLIRASGLQKSPSFDQAFSSPMASDSRLFDRNAAWCHAAVVPEAPLMPEDRGDPAAEGVPDLTFGAPGPVTPAAELRRIARFAAGLSRQHGWRMVAARLTAFAILLGVLLFALAQWVKG